MVHYSNHNQLGLLQVYEEKVITKYKVRIVGGWSMDNGKLCKYSIMAAIDLHYQEDKISSTVQMKDRREGMR